MNAKRIILIRHAHTEDYSTNGDMGASITEKGWRQTPPCGQALSRYLSENNITELPAIHISPLLRPQQSLRGILLGMDSSFQAQEPRIYEDIRLIEKNFTGLGELYNELAQSDDLQKQEFARLLLEFSNAAYEKDPFIASPPFGDSNMDVSVRTKDFIRSINTDLIVEGRDTAIVMAHGSVMNHIIAGWLKLPVWACTDKERGLNTPSNCEIDVIEGTPKKWNAYKVYDGETQEYRRIDLTKDIPRLTVDDLPPAPGWLENEL